MIFCMTQTARALEIACDSCTQKLYLLNWPKMTSVQKLKTLVAVAKSQE